MVAGEITIRSLKGPQEYHEAEQVQKQAWNMHDVEIVPSHFLITAAKNGGLVLGAFAGEQMVGMLLGFLGQGDNGRVKHCSHMMGILPSHRGQGIGKALKWSQRTFALEQGLELITWTYDPLESVNAMLNIARLGATSRTYLRNIYGEMRDKLNQGLESDRLQVDWWIRSGGVTGLLNGKRRPATLSSLQEAGGVIVSSARSGPSGFLQPHEWTVADAPVVLFEIPPNFQELKNKDMTLARAWRQFAREIFEHYFGEGYQVADFLNNRIVDRKQFLYVLEKDSNL